jgi:PAS domain S-box-containing protein
VAFRTCLRVRAATVRLGAGKPPQKASGGPVAEIDILGRGREDGPGDALFQRSLLGTQTEASAEGILVVSPEGRMVSFNRRFVEMWGIPEDVAASRSDEAALSFVRSKLADPEPFLARVSYLYEHPEEESRDEIPLLDGRTFERYSAPVRDENGNHYGRVWFFRDVTGARRTEEELRRTVGELDAVYRVADAVVRTDSLHEVFDSALDAVAEALGAERSSILLVDDDHVMRFRAWRGLSEEYRAAAEGYSPWPAGARDPEPVLVPDVEEDAGLASFRGGIRAEGIRALAFIPLVHQRRLVGKFVVYYREPHEFASREVELARAVASHIAAATERAFAQEGLRESRDQLAAILAAVADGITVQDPSGRLVFANDAAARITGFDSAEELLATPVAEVMGRFEVLDENRGPLPLERLPGRRALAEGIAAEETVCYRVRATGEEQWSVVRATPVRGEGGGVEFAVNAFQDITARRRAEERARLLARAGIILSSSLDYEATLRSVAELALPRVADWCIVYVLQPDGSIRRIALEHAGGQADRVREALDRHPLRPDAEVGVPRVIRTGRPEMVERIDASGLTGDVVDPVGLAAELADLALGSYMCVPLIARERTLGAITLLSGESGRRFGADDLELAEELARRTALAVDNARLYGEVQASARATEESLALLDAVLASAPVGIGFWDTDLRYVRVNEALAEINGLPAPEHVGKTLAEVVPTLAPALEPIYRRVLDTGEPYMHHETTGEVPTMPGEARHWLTSYYPVRGVSGDTRGLGAVILEITDRRRAEDERALRVRQQAVVAGLGQMALEGAGPDELMQEAVARLAETLGVEYANVLELEPDGTALLLRAGVGWKAGLVGSAVVSAGKDSQAGATLASKAPVVVEDLRSESRFSGPPLLREHGVVGGMSVVIGKRERPFGVLGVHTRTRRVFTTGDVTYLQAVASVLAAAVERARAEEERATLLRGEQEARREAEARAQASKALEFVGDGVFMLDRAGVIRLWNPAAEVATGLLAREVEGRAAEEAVAGWPELVPRIPIVGAEAMSAARPETLPLDVGGRELWLSISGVGFDEGTVFAFRDVTEERGVDKLKSDFVSTVSHELRTPLAAIYGAALTLRRADLGHDAEHQDALLDVIASESQRLARIVNDILWTSRIEAGGLQVNIEVCDCGALAGAVVQAARLHLPPNVSLELELPERLPPIAADADKVRQVLMNLVENAIKYSPDGGRVEVRAGAAPGGVRFSVHDDGLGIPPVEQERIFEKFYRLDPDLTRGVGGTGLGLYICRQLVERMGGRIWVESDGRRGSTFAVELPAVGDDVSAHALRL